VIERVTTSTPRRSIAVAGPRGLAVMLLVASVVLAPAESSAQPAGPFTATASARMSSVTFGTAPPLVFDPLLDPAGGTAQAQVDSIGTSQAFATNLYPSTAVLSVPGLIPLATGGKSLPLPDYPLQVSSHYPDVPSSSRGAGTVVLNAGSTARTSTALASDGSTRALSTASFDEASGDAVATADTTANSIELGGLITLHGVRCVAEVRKSTSGQLRRTTTFEVASLSILGTQVDLSPGNLAVLGRDVPVGADANPLLMQLLGMLAQRGVTIEPFSSQVVGDGLIAAGLRVRDVVSAPPQLASEGVERVIATFTVGGNAASVSNRALPALPGFSAAPGSRPAPDGSTVVPPASVTSGVGENTPPLLASGLPLRETAPSALSASVPDDISISRFYLLLVAAGVVLYAAARSSRFLGGQLS
jgi:hypothetical protein